MSIDFGTMLAQLVIFLLLYWFLKKYAFGPLMKMMKARQEYIESQIHVAEQNRTEAEKLAAEHRQAIEAAKRDAHELMENGRKTGERQAQEILKAAEEEARRLKEEALTDIAREKENAIAELKEQVGLLTVLLAEKVVAKEIDLARHQVLIDDAVKELGDRVC
ncbi:F0F1 ATP synthase subunit B [Fodinisporobacter ferrooxydans]|uniref:ATP synthase subunit b n=1 Tax=Fodinisporobacter ferrooxydans TaxID=2901836 RepID=A0ABY4CMD5_9BACL|nr:F0F1 ATP synthase subunit B [Alicyclobacillaceae bacterium MYW30-H2]